MVRRLLIRQPDGTVVIPASTWKGSFRAIAERLCKKMTLPGLEGLAAKLYRENGHVTYELKGSEAEDYLKKFKEVVRGEAQHESIGGFERLKEVLLELGYTMDEIIEVKERGSEVVAFRRMAEDYLALYCPVGRLFGNGVMAGKVRFFDVFLPGIRCETRPGVGIDRSFGAARPDILYFLEVIPRGATFQLTMVADNLKQGEADSLLFAATLEWIMELGLQIGARKSAGLGEITLVNSQTAFYLVELEKDEGGMGLANPMKRGMRYDTKGFIDWLRGQK
jgi:CRISPR/Cas system CSM-associated protein Csm3 (group 7 of RAMP superfamily)